MNIRLLLLASVVLAPLGLCAKDGEPASTPPKAQSETKPGCAEGERSREKRGNIEAAIHLHRLLSMSDEQLARSRAVIEKVEKLSPAERAELRKRLDSMREAAPEEREAFSKELREKFGIAGDEPRPKEPGKPGEPKASDGLPRGGARNLLDKHFATMTPEQSKAEREKFLAMPREEKVAYLKALREKYGLPAQAEGKGGGHGKGHGMPEGNPPPGAPPREPAPAPKS